jgi:aromatic-L-amino-acid/L-tryptophan decarboxylase
MAWFPASSTYPGMLGELYSSAFTAAAFNWLSSPAITELETIVLDWLAKLLKLPSSFLSSGEGGGVIQGSASEAVVTVMVAARDRYLRESTAHLEDAEREKAIDEKRGRLVALGSEMAHSCTQKAALIAGTKFRAIPAELEDNFVLTGKNFRNMVDQCRLEGLEPFYLTASLGRNLLLLHYVKERADAILGTTGTCAVDKFGEIADVLRENSSIWVHVDAAYAGAALVCEEYQHLTQHMGTFDSFDVNMHKWLLTNFDAR